MSGPCAWLIRHGESVANAGDATSDFRTIALTPRGHAQAGYIVVRPTLIVTSAFLRTKETAAPTIARHPAVPHEEWCVEEFTCIAPSRCRNTTTSQRRPLVEEFWQRGDPDYSDGEGAESFSTLMRRVAEMLRRLRECRDDDRVAIFTHGGFMRALMFSFRETWTGPGAMARFRAFERSVVVPNAAILELSGRGDALALGALETRHLPPELMTR